MLRCTLLVIIAFAWFGTIPFAMGEEELFEDDFDGTLSSEWRAIGLKKDDYRIRDGGLEMRVQPGRRTRDAPMPMVLLPFETSEFVTASVEVTLQTGITGCDSTISASLAIERSFRGIGTSDQARRYTSANQWSCPAYRLHPLDMSGTMAIVFSSRHATR